MWSLYDPGPGLEAWTDHGAALETKNNFFLFDLKGLFVVMNLDEPVGVGMCVCLCVCIKGQFEILP